MPTPDVSTAILSSEVPGAALQGTPGNVLTFGLDGIHVGGMPGSSLPVGTFQNQPVGWDVGSGSYLPTETLAFGAWNDSPTPGLTATSIGKITIQSSVSEAPDAGKVAIIGAANVNVTSDVFVALGAGSGDGVANITVGLSATDVKLPVDSTFRVVDSTLARIFEVTENNLLGVFGHAPTFQAEITGTTPTDPIVLQLLQALAACGIVKNSTTP